jgi:hypothetical protein
LVELVSFLEKSVVGYIFNKLRPIAKESITPAIISFIHLFTMKVLQQLEKAGERSRRRKKVLPL